jgi:hypothetical protein
MIALPHDTSDLLLAPVLLAVDANIDRLAVLTLEELAVEVALVSNIPDRSRPEREQGLIRTVCQDVDCHGWQFAWVARGLQLSHHQRHVVLGVPQQFGGYLHGHHRITYSD